MLTSHHLNKLIYSCVLLLSFFFVKAGQVFAQETRSVVTERVNAFVSAYKVNGYTPSSRMRADSVRIDEEAHTLSVFTNEAFSSQPFTPQSVQNIYNSIQRSLPTPYNTFRLNIYSPKGKLIEDLVPNILREEKADANRLWGKTSYSGNAWVSNTSLPYSASKGLGGRHLFIWPSHGRYFKQGSWQWQRPYLYCTTEDLFTQSFVYAFLFPMLEKAGAVVCSPRERDVQTHMCVVDNDSPTRQGTYAEGAADDGKWTSSGEGEGFRMPYGLLNDSTYPFQEGTYRMAPAVNRKNRLSCAVWTPDIPATGRYAVYVSYASRGNSVNDAHYSVFHKGGRTNFVVNQQMGGGTWVYLGTFEFEKGSSSQGKVMLTNQSDGRGVVTADGVRFGGGFAQNERGEAGTSGLPRFLEAARYHAQFCGLPDTLFNTEQGLNDYNDDLRVRANMLNYMGGRSAYIPADCGLGIPFELSLALHSDAGTRPQGQIYGSLAICTTKTGMTDEANTDEANSDNQHTPSYPSGLSRMASQDFAGLLLNNLTTDLSRDFAINWTRRELWDRNYAETRMPDVPSAILEMLSHQNFEDMKYGHDPLFKFSLARSVYKSILRYVNFMHGTKDVAVEPLPVHAFSATLSADGSSVRLQWKPTTDEAEPTARPTSYVVYTKTDADDFDNGQNIGASCSYIMPISANKQYSFRVTAVNAGGESFPSETLSVMYVPSAKKRILLVNGFTRVSGPAWVERNDSLGFDLKEDIGVPYLYTTAFAGEQRNFSSPSVSASAGHCGNELMGKTFAGNTFDFPVAHGQAIAQSGRYSFDSASREAFEQSDFALTAYAAIDYMAGLEADKTYNLRSFAAFPAATRRRLSTYLKDQGGALLASGAYLASDASADKSSSDFLEDVLKCRYDGRLLCDTCQRVTGLNTAFDIFRQPCAEHYAAQHPDAVLPTSGKAFSLFAYGNGQGAGVAFKGRTYRTAVMAFPFECIKSAEVRGKAMGALLDFLTR